MVLLRHQLPDATHHFDLLLAPRPVIQDEERDVATWRCTADPCALQPGDATLIQRIAPHRGLYLRLLEARELGGDRGVVAIVRSGSHRWVDGQLELTIQDLGTRRYLVTLDRIERLT